MKTRFVVILDTSTKAQDDAFVKILEANNMTWWRWLNKSTWLIVSFGGATRKDIHQMVKANFGDSYDLVVEVENGYAWIGFGLSDPDNRDRNMFNWMNNVWTKP